MVPFEQIYVLRITNILYKKNKKISLCATNSLNRAFVRSHIV